MPELEKLYTVDEIAKMTALTTRTIRNYLRSGTLKGRKIGAFYGCLLLRPSGVMAFDNAENPTIIEDFIKAIGATPVIFPYRNECCGGYVTLENKPLAVKKASAVTASARVNGAECLITACPLCMYNLKENAEGDMPVYYFTELLAEALGVKEDHDVE